MAEEMADSLCLELGGKGAGHGFGHSPRGIQLPSGEEVGARFAGLDSATSSSRRIIACTEQLFDRIVDRSTPVRRISLTFNHVMDEAYRPYDLFTSRRNWRRRTGSRRR